MLLINCFANAQSDTTTRWKKDTAYNELFYAPRVALSYQRNFGLEVGITRIRAVSGLGAGGLIASYLSGQIIYSQHKPIYALKSGYEVIMVGNIAIPIGIDATAFIYNNQYYACVTPHFVLPITKNATPLLLIAYGYNINDFKSFGSQVGNHCFSIIMNVCPKQHKAINQFNKTIRSY